MSDNDPTDESTIDLDRDRPETPGQPLVLAIWGDGLVATCRLPSEGEISIGRSSECDLRIEHATVSRKHARLRVSPLTIEDLGSNNGTKVGGRAVEAGTPTPVGKNDVIEIDLESAGDQTKIAITPMDILPPK